MMHSRPGNVGLPTGAGQGVIFNGVGADLCNRLPLARLPSFPQVLTRLFDLCQKESVNLEDIADLVRQDAAMAARVMTIATSTSQHGRLKTANLDRCLSMLGMSAVKTIVINESIFQVFRHLTSERDYDLRRFWGHSLRCALIARQLARSSGQADPDEAYLGGLLHDAGQLAILAADPGNYVTLFQTNEGADELCKREQALFELTHAEVGAWMIDKWDLDSLLSDSVLYHHDMPERLAGAHPLIRLVHFSDRLAALRGDVGSIASVEPSRQAFGECGIDLSKLLLETESHVQELAVQLGITTDPAATPGEGFSVPASGVQGSLDLAHRVRDVLLLENALKEVNQSNDQQSALEIVAQAMQVLFNVRTEIVFLAQGNLPASRYVASPARTPVARAAQLEFEAGNQSEIARSIESGVRFMISGAAVSGILDDQLLRVTGKPGLVYMPLKNHGVCHGILVAGMENPLQYQQLNASLPCLGQFALTAGRMIAGGSGAQAGWLPGGAAAGDDHGHARLQRMVHEIGNPLSVIQNYLSLLQQRFTEKDIDTRELSIVSEEIRRVTRILSGAIARKAEGNEDVGPFGLNTLIEDMVALCRPTATHRHPVHINTDLSPDIPFMNADADRLRQLILNLLRNSLEALSSTGGVISVATRLWNNGNRPSHVEISIEDSGPGLPAEVLEHLYQPVTTSKGMHHHGLGLSIVGQLVRDLEGLINCHTSDRGTRFQILLGLK